jgi:hypothetical protein
MTKVIDMNETWAAKALEAFIAKPGHERFEEVRQTMYHMVELQMVKGKTYDKLFERAYKKACKHLDKKVKAS